MDKNKVKKDDEIAHDFFVEIEKAIKTALTKHKKVSGRLIILPLLYHVLTCFDLAGIDDETRRLEIEEFFKAHAKISKE